MRFLHILVYGGLFAVLGAIILGGLGCGSGQKVQKRELKPEHVSNEDGFVRTSPNQDEYTIVRRGTFVTPPGEIDIPYEDIMKGMLEEMAEESLKAFLGVKK